MSEFNNQYQDDHNAAAYEMFITGEMISFEKLMMKVKKKNTFTEQQTIAAHRYFDEFCRKTLEIYDSVGPNFTRDDLKKAMPDNFWIMVSYK